MGSNPPSQPKEEPTPAPPLTSDDVNNFKAKLTMLKNQKPLSTLQKQEHKIIEQSGISIPEIYNFALMGPQHSGKSALINTICRVVNEDQEQIIQYVPTSHSTSEDCKMLRKIDLENCNFRLIDCIGVSVIHQKGEIEILEMCLEQGVEPGFPLTIKGILDHINSDYKIHGIVVVVAPVHLNDAMDTLKNLFHSMKIGNRLPFLVLTHKDEMNNDEMMEKKSTLVQSGNSDLIYCVANYVCPLKEDHALFIPKRRKDTEYTVLEILKTFFKEADQHLVYLARHELDKKKHK